MNRKRYANLKIELLKSFKWVWARMSLREKTCIIYQKKKENHWKVTCSSEQKRKIDDIQLQCFATTWIKLKWKCAIIHSWCLIFFYFMCLGLKQSSSPSCCCFKLGLSKQQATEPIWEYECFSMCKIRCIWRSQLSHLFGVSVVWCILEI